MWKVMNRVGDNKGRRRSDGMGEIMVENAIEEHREGVGGVQSGIVRNI